jgi:pimeloyl-ACP methyl ester carboxylesterase
MSRESTVTERSAGGARIAALAGAGLAAGVVAQRRRTRALARDDEYRALTAPLGGDRLEVVSSDGTRLHALSFAGSETGCPATVVLAHGWTERLSLWSRVIAGLRDRGLRVVAYDLRGHGSSELAADGDYAIERFGEDVEAVLLAAGGPASQTVVVGHSLGGMSIAAWAARHDVRERVAGALITNAGVDDLIGGALVFGALGSALSPRWLSRGLLSSSVPLPPLSTPIGQATIRRIAFGSDATRAQVAFYERMLIETPASVRAATGIALSDLDLRSALARLTVSTVVIAGDEDRLTPPAHSQRIAAALPDPAGLIVLERTGHMSPLERPREVAEAVATLTESVVGADAATLTESIVGADAATPTAA